MRRPYLVLILTGLILLICGWTNKSHAGQQVVTVCDPNCHEVVVITPDDNTGIDPSVPVIVVQG